MPTLEDIIQLLLALKLKKARALAVFLIMEPGRERRNELIFDLLWQNADAKKASASLRQTVRHLRKAAQGILEFPLVTRNGYVTIDFPRDWALFADITAAFDEEKSFPSITHAALTLIEQFELLLGVSSNFDSWLSITQDRAISEFRSGLERTMAKAKPRHAQRAAEFLQKLEPCNEAAARHLMLHLWRAGEAKRAIEHYNRLYQELDEAFDQEPEAATIELLAAIKLDPEGGGQPTISQQARPSKVTLLVEETESENLKPRDKSFQSVLSSDLRSRLGRFREWQVIATQPEDSDFLLIRPRLLPFDGRYRFVVDVISTQSRELIWSEILEDPQNDWIGKVRVLILNICNALRVVVADRQGADDRADLYDRWLQSLALKGTWSHEDEERAAALLRGITKEAPDFGPAHAELAGIYNIRHILRPGTRQEPRLRDIALSHALDAVAADAMDTRAHRVLAWCYCHTGEFDLAEFHFEQSLQLNAQNTQTLASSVLGFAFCDNPSRTREMLDELERLPQTLEPFHDIYLAAAYYLLGDYNTAARYCEGGGGLMSTVGGWHSAALAKLGRHHAARERLESYHREIASIWCGPQTPGLCDVVDWYVDCFPLRSGAVRDDLRSTLYGIGRLSRSVTHVGDVDADRTVES